MTTIRRRTAADTRAAFDLAGELIALVADGEPGPLSFLDAEGVTAESVREHLGTLTSDELATVIAAAIDEGRAIGEGEAPIVGDLLARVVLLAETREAADTRATELQAEAEQQEQAAQAALARLAPPAAAGPEGEGEGAEGTEGEGAEGTEGAAAEPQAVAASSAPVTPRAAARRSGTGATPALPRPGQVPQAVTAGAAPVHALPRAQTAMTAAADLQRAGLQMGQVIETRRQLGDAFDYRRDALRDVSGGNGEKVPVVQIASAYPEERQLGRDAAENHSLIASATTREVMRLDRAAMVAAGQLDALTAATGGLCAPVQQLFDVPVLGSAARPVRDALTGFGAERGKVSWREHIAFGDLAGATGVWTLQTDANPGSTTKPCIEVECGDNLTAEVEALTLCLEFSNVTSRFDPEGTAANIDAAQIAHARFAENRLLNKIAALSTTLTAPAVLSAVRDLLVNLDQLIAAYRNRYRLDDDQPLRMVNPRWLRDLIRADLTRGMAGELQALAVANAVIDAWFAARNVNITWHLDGRAATTAGAGEVAMPNQFYAPFTDNAPVPEFPSKVESLLWVEGEMLHLDGGQLDLGIVRDSTLNAKNRYRTFSETFEGVAFRGVEAVRLVSEVAPTGMVAGTADTAAILAA